MKRLSFLYGPACLLMLLFCACHSREVSKKSLVRLVEHDHKFNQEQDVGGIKIRLQYIPYQLMVAQELQGTGDGSRIATLENKYKGQYYFKLYLSKNNKEIIRQLGGMGPYSDMVEILSFRLGEFVNATTEKRDTVSLADYAFEQDYGLSPANTLLLAFPKKDFNASDRITVNIGELGLGIGALQFDFKKGDLNGLPKLNYEHID
ncbi:MAG TPA: hypothetical protein VGM31_00260 [Puia sp.]|jgi:hypothetical protein